MQKLVSFYANCFYFIFVLSVSVFFHVLCFTYILFLMRLAAENKYGWMDTQKLRPLLIIIRKSCIKTNMDQKQFETVNE